MLNIIQAKPGEKVLDFCAGSGGKTLAFAPRMENRGQVFLHDIKDQMLKAAKKRLKRAGITNYAILQPNCDMLARLRGAIDWVSLISMTELVRLVVPRLSIYV